MSNTTNILLSESTFF